MYVRCSYYIKKIVNGDQYEKSIILFFCFKKIILGLPIYRTVFGFINMCKVSFKQVLLYEQYEKATVHIVR